MSQPVCDVCVQACRLEVKNKSLSESATCVICGCMWKTTNRAGPPERIARFVPVDGEMSSENDLRIARAGILKLHCSSNEESGQKGELRDSPGGVQALEAIERLELTIGQLESQTAKPDASVLVGTDLHIAIQRGAWRHDIVAVCTTLKLAQELGRASIASEADHYHDVEIVKRSLDAAGPEVLVGTLRGRTEGRKFDQALCRSTSTLLGIDWIEGDE